MSHSKDAARDLAWGRQGGRWAAEDDGRSLAEIKADHLVEHPDGCKHAGCVWCAERRGEVPSLFDDGGDTA